MGKWVRGLVIAVLSSALALAVAPAIASAGQWVQDSCVNPNGSAATNEGWTTSSSAAPPGSSVSDTCGPGQAMDEYLPASNGGATEGLMYAPPAGSTLAGGNVVVSGYSGGSGANTTMVGVVDTPAAVYPGDSVFQCIDGNSDPCAPSYSYSNYTVTIPANEGGGVDVLLDCSGGSGYSCNGTTNPAGYDGQMEVSSAALLLSNSSTPAGSGFAGTLLSSPTQGASADLVFTATDPSGPGVYTVGASIDGTSVYSATPNTNNGACASVGTYPGTSALEFGSAQPCLQSESVTVPVNTANLSPGSHELTVTVTDAAGNTATVLDQYITIVAPPSSSAPVTSPAPASPAQPTTTKHTVSEVKARFAMDWHFSGAISKLLKITALKLPKTAKVVLSDSGPSRPRIRPASASAKSFQKLMRGVERLKFHAGDTLTITINVKGEKSERIRISIRKDKVPTATLLKYR